MIRLHKFVLRSLLSVLTVVSLRAEGPATSASAINSQLQVIYQGLLTKEGKPIPLSTDVDALTESLSHLYALDPDIRALGPGVFDGNLRGQANLYRAMA